MPETTLRHYNPCYWNGNHNEMRFKDIGCDGQIQSIEPSHSWICTTDACKSPAGGMALATERHFATHSCDFCCAGWCKECWTVFSLEATPVPIKTERQLRYALHEPFEDPSS